MYMENDDLARVVARGGFVLGEYTTNVGPFAEDHFFVFISAADGEREWAADDPVVDRLLGMVATHAGEDVSPTLANSTDFASRVLYPPSLRGSDLYRFVPEMRGWLKDLWVGRVHREFAPDVRAYLELERTRLGQP